MFKNIIKEIFIMLLLCVAILLILAVVFYEYNPINKIIPTTLSYKMPEELKEVKEEINTTLITQEEQVIKTYELTEDEINLNRKVNYEPGKANPFEAYSENVDNNTDNSTSNNTNSNKNNNTNSSKGNTTNTNSTGSFFEDGSSK